VIISKLYRTVIILTFALYSQTQEAPPAVNIGGVSELKGNAEVLRDKTYKAVLDFDIASNDQAITRNGRMAITFLDDSKVRLTENSKLVIDKYIFDPDPSKSQMALKFASGTARFITSKLGKIAKQNIQLSTPTAQITIRGTDFTCTVDELGRSLIILLPDSSGLPSGEILVTTAIGSVTLNRPYQATTVDVFESAPSSPVILDLTLDIIDNMLIVSPPKEEVVLIEETTTQTNDILNFNELDIDYLAEDELKEDSLEFTELDYDALDTNFLEDLLQIIDEFGQEEEDALQDVTSTVLTGTKLGQDQDTQITSFITGGTVTLQRQVSNFARVDLNVDGSYTVIFIQDGISRVVKVNGGSSSVIRITQD
tara:strand:- start:677 stop:1780 length:1104 start_codon:yes stop_codon:yes gene_type:complete